MIRITATRRDFIFFILLVVMIKVALNKQPQATTDQIVYAPANNQSEASKRHLEEVQQEEAQEEVAQQADDMVLNFDDEQDLVHPPEKHIMEQLNDLLAQVDTNIQTFDQRKPEAANLKGIRHRLLYLRRKYQHTSPAIVLLGPIGTTGIVLQEQQLEKELAKIETSLQKILS